MCFQLHHLANELSVFFLTFDLEACDTRPCHHLQHATVETTEPTDDHAEEVTEVILDVVGGAEGFSNRA